MLRFKYFFIDLLSVLPLAEQECLIFFLSMCVCHDHSQWWEHIWRGNKSNRIVWNGIASQDAWIVMSFEQVCAADTLIHYDYDRAMRLTLRANKNRFKYISTFTAARYKSRIDGIPLITANKLQSNQFQLIFNYVPTWLFLSVDIFYAPRSTQ